MGGQRRVLVAQLIRFNFVGALTVFLGTAVFFGILALGLNYVVALAGDYGAGIIFSYMMNKRFTFGVQVESNAKPFAITVLTYFTTFLLNVVLLSMAVESLGINIVVSQIVIIFILAVLNFVMFKFVIFRNAR